MYNLPIEIQRNIYELDPTFRQEFEKTLNIIPHLKNHRLEDYYTNDEKDYAHNTATFQIEWNVDTGGSEDDGINHYWSVYTSIFSDHRDYFDETDMHNIKVREKDNSFMDYLRSLKVIYNGEVVVMDYNDDY